MALQPYQSYGDATSTTHAVVDMSTGMTAMREVTKTEVQAEITTKTADIVIKFGNSSAVEADATLTSDAYPQGNYHCLAGTVKTIKIPASCTHFSHEAVAGTGNVYVTIGHGEKL
jgi:hypothetical protein